MLQCLGVGTREVGIWNWKWKCQSLSHVRLFVSPWTVAHRAPPSMALFHARILEGVAISSSRESSQPRDRTHVSSVSCIASGFFSHWAIREALRIPQKLGPQRSASSVKKKGQGRPQSKEGETERIVSRCPGVNNNFIKNRESESPAGLIKCTFETGWTGAQILKPA